MDEKLPPPANSGEEGRTEYQKRVDRGEPPRDILEELYRRLQGKLFATVRRSVKNSADAEDVVTEVLIKMEQHFGEMITREPVDGWVFKVAAREVANHFRRKVPIPLPVEPEESARDKSAWDDRTRDRDVGDAGAESVDSVEFLRMHLRALVAKGATSRADLGDYWQQIVMGVPQKEIADRRGVTQPRISQLKSTLETEVRITLYLCVVLGTVRPPYRESAIREHLDLFDLAGSLRQADRDLLRRAGSVVSRGLDGLVELRPKRAETAIGDPKTGPVSTLEELHESESAYAIAIGNGAPRCIARPCRRHATSGGTEGEIR